MEHKKWYKAMQWQSKLQAVGWKWGEVATAYDVDNLYLWIERLTPLHPELSFQVVKKAKGTPSSLEARQAHGTPPPPKKRMGRPRKGT